MARRTDLKPEKWCPESPSAAADELRKLLEDDSEVLPALMRSWCVAIEVAPIVMPWVRTVEEQADDLVPAPNERGDSPAELEGSRRARELLGDAADERAVAIVAEIIDDKI